MIEAIADTQEHPWKAWTSTALYAFCEAHGEAAERQDLPFDGNSPPPGILTSRAMDAIATLEGGLAAYSTRLRSNPVDEDIADRLVSAMAWRVRVVADLGAAFPDRRSLQVIGIDPILVFSRVVATAYLGLTENDATDGARVQPPIAEWSSALAVEVFAEFLEIWNDGVEDEMPGSRRLMFPERPIAIPGGTILLHDYFDATDLKATRTRFIGDATYAGTGFHGFQTPIVSPRLALITLKQLPSAKGDALD